MHRLALTAALLLAARPAAGAPHGPARDRAGTAAADIQCTLILGLLVVLPIAAWLQHVYSCLLSGSWGFLIGGTLFLPAGLIHGIGQWLGFWH